METTTILKGAPYKTAYTWRFWKHIESNYLHVKTHLLYKEIVGDTEVVEQLVPQIRNLKHS